MTLYSDIAVFQTSAGIPAWDPEEFACRILTPGSLVLDTRDPLDFFPGFVPGSINIGIDGNFAEWASTLLGEEHQAIFLVCEPGREAESVKTLARLGYGNIKGHLDNGFDAWLNADLPIDGLNRISPASFVMRQGFGIEADQILDVRDADEHAAGAIPKSLNIPLESLQQALGQIPRNKTLYVLCSNGYRSMIAASILKAANIRAIHVEGGCKALSPLMTRPIRA